MGYCMYQRDYSFIIKKENFEKALDAIKKTKLDYDDISKCSSLVNVIEELGWNPGFDENGNIDSLYFGQDKLCDEEIWLDAIAPFVEIGSFIEMIGEDGNLWRWIFDGKNCIEISPKIIWEM